MKNKRINALASIVMLLIITCGLVHPVSVHAAVNKAMKVSGLSFSNNKAENRYRGAEMMATPLNPDTLTKKTMKLSGKICIPAKAFQKANDEIMITPELALSVFPVVREIENAGIIYAKYDIILKYTKNKKIVIYKEEGRQHKRTKLGTSVAAVKKSGTYYLVTIKNVPLTGDCLDKDDKPAKIKTNKKFILNAGFGVFSSTAKAWKGTIYLDDIKLKTASMTQTITFNKKDYQGYFATNWASGTPKAAIVKK